MDAVTATTPGASTAYMGAKVSPVVTNAAGTGAASLAQQLSLGLTKFAPFGGQKFTDFLQSALAKNERGIPFNAQEAKALQSLMWMFSSLADSRG